MAYCYVYSVNKCDIGCQQTCIVQSLCIRPDRFRSVTYIYTLSPVGTLSDSSSPSLQGDKVSLQLWGDIILEHPHCAVFHLRLRLLPPIIVASSAAILAEPT